MTNSCIVLLGRKDEPTDAVGLYIDCLTIQTFASGTAASGTSTIAVRTCALVVTTAAIGVTTTATLSYFFNAVPTGAYTAGPFVSVPDDSEQRIFFSM
jgi:hypothetical protein